MKLSAAHRSGRIVIEVSDDGAGIDRQRVREIAIKKGLIPGDAQLSDSEIDNLLFLPGFSTAQTVSAISGRGVGMDVVKRSIQALGGRITIASRPGHGSTFSMSLPLTLAVLDGMVVKVADQTLVVPLTAIVETLRPKHGDLHALGVNAHVISDRGGFAPLIDVGQELGYRTDAGRSDRQRRARRRDRGQHPVRAGGRRDPRPAPGGDQEPRGQLSASAGHRRRDDPRRRAGRPDSRHRHLRRPHQSRRDRLGTPSRAAG